MDFCIVYGTFLQNWFPGFAHILHVEFLTVNVAEKIPIFLAYDVPLQWARI